MSMETEDTRQMGKTWIVSSWTWKLLGCLVRMHGIGISVRLKVGGVGESANLGLPGKWPLKRCVCAASKVALYTHILYNVFVTALS